MRCHSVLLYLLVGSVQAQWVKHSNVKCWRNYGGFAQDPKDTPIFGATLAGCQQACIGDENCQAIVRQNISDQTSGECWLRVAVDIKFCQDKVAFDTYQLNGRNPFKWIADIEKGPAREVMMPAGRFYIDRQYVLPQNLHLEGAGVGKTIIQAVRFSEAQQNALCGPYHVNRIGIIVGDNTYVGGFTFTGADERRPSDNSDLCGGAAIETPGCAFPYCANPHTDTDEPGPNINTGKGDGNGVGSVIIENINITANTVQNMVFIPQTEKGKRVSSDIVVRNVHTTGTWADGLNIHGAHKNVLVEGCSASDCGDDCFAAWDTAVPNEFMTNVTFRNNYANSMFSHRDCFSQFGGLSVNYIGNICENPFKAMFHFWIEFCGSGQHGSPGKGVCYPPESVTYMSNNTLLANPYSAPKVLRDDTSKPTLPKICYQLSCLSIEARVV